MAYVAGQRSDLHHAGLRSPPRWSRCLGDGSTPARQQDGSGGLIVVKLRDRSSRRDPDIVQNCSLCRHVAAGGALPGCVDSHRPDSLQSGDVDEVQSRDRRDNSQFERY